MGYYEICYVKSAYYPPVMGTEFYEHSQQAAKLGHCVCVIAAGRQEEAEKERDGDVQVYRVNLPANCLLRNVFFAVKALKLLFLLHFDIVHVYAFGKCFILPLLGKVFLSDKRTKWVYNLIQVNTVDGMRGSLQNKKAKFAGYFFDAVIVSDYRENGEIKRRILGKHFSKPCFFVPVGANLDRFSPVSQHGTDILRHRYNITKEQVILIYIGTLSPLRNLATLVRAFKTVSDDFENVRLLFVGDGGDMPQLTRLCQELHISDKVVFTGFIDYNRVPEYLSIADIGVSYIPINEFFDCQPVLKTLEYLASGLPVVATNTSGNRVSVRHGYNGFLANDYENDFAQSMASLVADAKLRQRLACNSRSSVNRFDWMRIEKDQLLPAYEVIWNRSE